MSTADLQNTSQMAIKLWTGRDAAYAQGDSTTANSRPRRNSFGSAYSHTVLGTGNRVGAAAAEVDHGMTCDGCAQVSISQGPFSARANNNLVQPIIGIRYQCANCPSYPKPVSLVRFSR